jgi:hypothetical protein
VSAVTAPLRRAHDERAQRRRHLRVVEEPVKRHTLVYVLAMILVGGAVIFGAVALNALAAGAAVEARELEAQVADSERLYAQLVADVAALEDPARIREAALELGLEPAAPARYVALERNLPADGAPAPRSPTRPRTRSSPCSRWTAR